MLNKAATLADQAERNKLYAQANNLVKQHVPMVPVAHGGSATAFKADVTGAHASPLSNENFSVMDAGRPQAVRLDAERRADRPVLRRRDRRRDAARRASRSASRCWPTRSAAPRSSRRWPRSTPPTPT